MRHGSEETPDVIRAEARLAEDRIRSHIRETPLEHSPFLSRETEASVFLKLENLQLTGSFKLRGAMNKVLSLSPEVRGRGAVTASSGNHGHAFAYLTDRFGFPGTAKKSWAFHPPASFSPTASSPTGRACARFMGGCISMSKTVSRFSTPALTV